MKSKRPNKKTRREKKRFKKKTILLIISLIAIVTSFLYLMNNEYFAIEEVRIEGQKTIIENDINIVVDEYLTGTIFGLIRRDNILFLSTEKLIKKLKETFPKIQEISAVVNHGDVLTIVIGERSVHSLWCINRVYESMFDEECYFADKNGLLYARAPYFSGYVYMKLFIEPRENELYIGTSIDAVDSFSDFFEFISAIENDYPLSLGNIIFTEFDDVSIEISRMKTQLYDIDKPVILYNQLHDYNVVLRDIGIIMDFDTFKEDFALSGRDLESIDVRFENRALYTFTPIPAL